MIWRILLLFFTLALTQSVSGSRMNPWTVDLSTIDESLFRAEDPYENDNKDELIERAILDGMFAVPLLEKLAHLGDKPLKKKAFKALCRLGPVAKQAEPTLIEFSQHAELGTRRWIYLALVRINGTGVDNVITALSSDNVGIQKIAMAALEEKFKYKLGKHFSYFIQELALRNEKGVIRKLEAMLKHSNRIVSRTAAQWLAEFGPLAEPAMFGLVDALKSKDNKLQSYSAIAIGNIGGIAHTAKADLMVVLEHSLDHESKASAAFALIQIGNYENGLALLLNQLDHTDWHVRQGALIRLLALNKLALEINSHIISQYLQKETKTENVIMALNLVEKLEIRDKELMMYIWQLANSPISSGLVKISAIQVLATVGDRSERLFYILKNKIGTQQYATYIKIMKTYWKLSQSDATPFVKSLLPYLKTNQQARSAALNTISSLADGASFALPYLIKTLVFQKIENEQDRRFYLETADLIIKLQSNNWSEFRRSYFRL